MSNPVLKLTYFSAWGRAGAIRAAFRIAGIEFQDARVSFQELKSAPAGEYPLGQLPVLSVDGKVFTQSGAILRYAGKRSGLYPSDAIEALRVDEVMSIADDILASAPQDPDAAIKKTKREAWVAEKVPKFLNLLDARLKESGGPYLLGTSLSIADLILFGLVHSVRTGNYDYVATDAFDKWTHVVATYEAVKAHPIVAAEIAPKADH